MQVSVSITHLAGLLKDADELGAMRLAVELGLVKPYLNKSEAIKKCGGKANYDQFVLQGLINPYRDGNDSAPYRIDRMEVERATRASNRHGYLTVEERMYMQSGGRK